MSLPAFVSVSYLLEHTPSAYQLLLFFVALWPIYWLYHRRWRAMRLIAVIDGDTFEAIDERGKKRRIRLYGVDCPELNQRNGRHARDYVKHLVGNSWVRVRLKERDKYRRHVAEIRINGKSLAIELLRVGLAYPIAKHWSLRKAAAGAWILRKGVHSGFGQKKPWQSSSRSGLGRFFKAFRRRR